MLTLKQKCEALQKAFARIGISGMYDDFVKDLIRKKKIPKLTPEEIEYVEPFVKMEQERRWVFWRFQMITIGESEEDFEEFDRDERWKTDEGLEE